MPTAAERTGNLSDLTVPFYNPCNGTNCNVLPAARSQFQGNVIQPSLLSPQALSILNLIPLPNIAGATGANPNYSASGSGIVNNDSFDTRVDRYQTEKLHMFGRYSFLRVGQDAPGAFGQLAGGPNYATTTYAGQSSLRSQSLSYGIDYAASPSWVNDFRFGFFRYRVFVNPNGLGTSPAKDAGIPGFEPGCDLHIGLAGFHSEWNRGSVLGLFARCQRMQLSAERARAGISGLWIMSRTRLETIR